MDHCARIPHTDALVGAIHMASSDMEAQVEWLRVSGSHFDEFDFPEGVEEGILDVLERVDELTEVHGLGRLDVPPPFALSSSGWGEVRGSAKALRMLIWESQWSGLVTDG
ncbi:hypothetical protein [Nocardiopsis listeri]|uniref:hypothetical protein n=1 Tax=Nocardiopsis listeri TaxID=53440 RepID=UPI00082E6591|nr:hypothetical protein [Nocardiopsis listeri]